MNIRSRFLRLLLGPAATVIVGVLSGPLISRLFTPEDFGRYSVLLGVVGIGVIAVTVRFEQLIPTSEDPASSFWIVLVCSLVGSLGLGVGGYVFFSPQEAAFVAIATFSVALFNGFYYLLVVAERPLRASAGRAIQASGILGGQVAFGSSGSSVLGLLWGEIAGRLVSLLFVCHKVERRAPHKIKEVFFSQWPAARWLLPGALLGGLALQILPLGMAISVGASSAGLFLLIYRMVVIPNSLLSKVASDTLLVELSRLDKLDRPVSSIVAKGLGKLILAALCLYGSLAIYGGWIFGVILGEQWSSSAALIPWLALFVGCWSVASPLAMVFVSLKKTSWSFGFSALDVVNRCLALSVGYLYQDVLVATAALAVGGAFVYGLSVLIAAKVAGTAIKDAIKPIMPSALTVVVMLVFSGWTFMNESWLLAGLFTSAAFCITGKALLHG